MTKIVVVDKFHGPSEKWGNIAGTKEIDCTQFLVDLSQTALTSRNTGIERVVRCIVSHLPDCIENNRLVRSLHLDGDFFALDDELQTAMKSLGEFEQRATQSYPVPLRKLLATVTKNRPFHKLQKVLLPAPSHLGIFKLPHSFLVYLAKQSRRRRGGEIAPNEKTILLLPDAYWTKMDVWPTVARYREHGCFVCTVVYDLIPISHPEFVGERRAEKFRKYIDCVIRNSDLIIAISDTVRQDISRYIQENYDENDTVCQRIASFQLGADVPAVSGTVRERTASLFVNRSAHSPYFVVGSFDPRKNHNHVLDAFELLWANGSNAQLCFAGRVGGLSENLVQRINAHPELGKRFHVFYDMNDAELQHAYKNCSGVILASTVEGFGLPIVESLWHGTKTFVSDIPIHREVGGNNCTFFPLNDPQILSSAIRDWESVKDSSESKTPIQPVSWAESARQLHSICMKAYNESRV
ncbi:MAG: glycosyltransferase family 4 protein [Pirellula sp.]|jgi:alpha-1,2-rhamnosyltransferase|nr:glycosyltransferase family 4 protein [Pirellula sp.]